MPITSNAAKYKNLTNRDASNILAIDTSTPICSVALCANGTISDASEIEPRQHSKILLPLIDDLLRAANFDCRALDGIIISAGPGAFTSLRVGAAVASGLAGAWDIPIAAVSSLALLAATANHQYGDAKILALFDARMGEVYAARYDKTATKWQLRYPERVCAPQEIASNWFDEATLIVGSGLCYPLPKNQARHDAQLLPAARFLFEFLTQLQWRSAYAGIDLNYLRNEVTQQ